MAKPSKLPEWNTTQVNSIEPDQAHKDEGWLAPGGVPEKPPFQTFNYWQNEVYRWLDEINIAGILTYDAVTDYIANISYVIGNDGNLYVCWVNNGPATAAVNPVGDTTGVWSIFETNIYRIDASEIDQGITGNGRTIKAYVDAIGTSKKATLILTHNGIGNTTVYTLTTSEIIPSNITLEIENGAILDGAGTLTINGSFKAGLSQVFGSSITIDFGDGAIKRAYPEWWGGKGDNSTDNLIPIQSAIDSITKGVVYLLPGIYRVSGALVINKSAIQLRGSGCAPGNTSAATTIRTTSATTNVLNLGDGSTIKYGIYLTDFLIDSTITRTAGSGIYANKASYIFIQRVNTFEIFNGIQLIDCIVPSLSNLDIRGTPDNATGIFIDGENGHFLNKIVLDTGASVNTIGIDIRSSGGTWLNDISVMHHKYGLVISPQAGDVVDWLFVSNSAFDFADSYCLYIGVGTGGLVRGLEFTGCWFASAQLSNIYITEGGGTVDGVQFTGCRVYVAQQDGVVLNSGINIFFDACKVAGNSNASPGTNHGISIQANLTDFAIRNCRIGQHADFGNHQNYGIFLNAGSSDRYIITSNDLAGNVTAGLTDNGTGSNKVVKSNLGYNPVGNATPAVPASTVAYTNAYGQDCMVTVYGGTVTVIVVSGTTTGLTSGTFLVPAGGTITITYSSTPTWTWNRN